MKNFKCPFCAREKQTADNIIMVVCAACQKEMKPFPFKYEREVEDGRGEYQTNRNN